MNKDDFQEIVWQRGRELYRDMPWRVDTDPYYVLVSELMLQQTQVDRVVPKFNAFIAQFPDIKTLATASLADVLILWNGLGYNRRAKFLHDAARKITLEFNNTIPATHVELITLPGVGPNTAGAIRAYGFDQPAIFIETNIRTVYFYHFFEARNDVTDTELYELVASTLDQERPRQWYQALMDYGTYLKKQGSGQIRKSKQYVKQSTLKGSIREVRGKIIRALTLGDSSESELLINLEADERYRLALDGLIRDGLVTQTGTVLHLTK